MKHLHWVFALYLVALVVAVSFPAGPARPPRERHYLNDTRAGNVDDLVQDVARNVALFMPAGYLGLLVVGPTRRRAAVIVVLACALFSFGIETMQHFFLTWRYSTWIDIVSNTAGGFAGAGLAQLLPLDRPPAP